MGARRSGPIRVRVGVGVRVWPDLVRVRVGVRVGIRVGVRVRGRFIMHEAPW